MPFDTATEIAHDTYFDRCPLVNRPMCEGECYDVQMVRSRFVNEQVLDFELDWDKANELCRRCPFNQLSDLSTNELVNKS